MRLDNMKSVALKFMSYAMWSRMVRLIAHLSLDPMAVGQMCRQLFFYRAFNTLSFNRVDGDYVEFGCYQARTFAMAYHESRRFRMPIKLWAFDSFCGMPKPKEECDIHPEWCQGDMSTPLNNFHKLCKLYGIPINAYNVVPGFYEETIENMLPTENPPIFA